jgi:biotin transport system substrate-specific component
VRVPPFERGLTLGDFLVPIRVGERAASWQRHLLMISVGTLLIVLGARISFYLGNPFVPVTLQTFGVLFGAALLGFRRALLAVGLYLLLGIVGLPVFALDASTGAYRSGLSTIVHVGGTGGFSLAPTGGYLIGFILAGGLVGRLAELGWDRHIGGSVGAMLLGNAVIYVIGVPWLMAATNQGFGWTLDNGLWPFVVGDLLKLAVAAGLLPVGWWLVKRRSSEP